MQTKKRSSVVLVFDDQDRLLLQLRAANDNSYPLHWDFSAAGGIENGESPEAAATRELKEELGIGASLTFLEEVTYKAPLTQDQLFIYKTCDTGPFSPNPVEVAEVKFFTAVEIMNMLKAGAQFHPEFPFVWDKGIIFPQFIKNK